MYLITIFTCVFATFSGEPHQPFKVYSNQFHNAHKKYADFLRARYKCDTLCSKWPHVCAGKYIELEAIIDEYSNWKEVQSLQQRTVQGSVDDIVEEKTSIAMQEILKLNHIGGRTYPVKRLLIESAPGIGKSTFAWEMCQKWGQHKLFNEYSLACFPVHVSRQEGTRSQKYF